MTPPFAISWLVSIQLKFAFIGSSKLNQIVFKVPSENSLGEILDTADLIESLLWSQSPTNEKTALEAKMPNKSEYKDQVGQTLAKYTKCL